MAAHTLNASLRGQAVGSAPRAVAPARFIGGRRTTTIVSASLSTAAFLGQRVGGSRGVAVAGPSSRRTGRSSRLVVKSMFERFTEKAIKVVMLAQEEARRLGHNFVGTEQLLLGLIGESTGIAAKVLKSMGVNLKDARVEVEKIIGRGSGFVAVEIPFTPRAKRVLEMSLEEARQLGEPAHGTDAPGICVLACGAPGIPAMAAPDAVSARQPLDDLPQGSVDWAASPHAFARRGACGQSASGQPHAAYRRAVAR